MPRMKRLLLLILIVSFFLSGFAESPPRKHQKLHFVTRVIDGDTIVLWNGDRVRYIGIDTPETWNKVEYFGPEATEANRKLVEGKEVRLEFDVQLSDHYGRLLAYVFVDGTFVNAWLVENGYAVVSTHPPNVKYHDLFLEKQKEARENKRGFWKN